MIKNKCRHAYKMLDHAECLWCEDCVEKLVARIRKPWVSREFWMDWAIRWKRVDSYYEVAVKQMLKEAGVDVRE